MLRVSRSFPWGCATFRFWIFLQFLRLQEYPWTISPGRKSNDITKLGFISTYNYLCVDQKGKYKIASAFFSIQNYQYKISIFQKKHSPRQTSLWNWYVCCRVFFCCIFGRLPFICILFCVLVVFCLLQGGFLVWNRFSAPSRRIPKVKFFIFQIEEPYSTSGYTCWTCDFAVTNHLSEVKGRGVWVSPSMKKNDLRWQVTHLIKQESLEIGSQLQ